MARGVRLSPAICFAKQPKKAALVFDIAADLPFLSLGYAQNYVCLYYTHALFRTAVSPVSRYHTSLE